MKTLVSVFWVTLALAATTLCISIAEAIDDRHAFNTAADRFNDSEVMHDAISPWMTVSADRSLWTRSLFNDHNFRRGEAAKSESIVKTALVGPVEGRKTMADAYKGQGFSAAEFEQAMSTQGWLLCPHSDRFRGNAGVATIVDADNIVATASHVLMIEYGDLRENIEACYFFTHAHPKIKHYIILETIAGREEGRAETDTNDFVQFHIYPSVSDTKPYKLASATDLKAEQQIYIMSGITDEDNRVVIGPKSQICKVRDFVEATNDHGRGVKTDCSSKPGDSGSAMLIRNSSHNLEFEGVLHGQGNNHDDHCSYDADSCYTSFTLASRRNKAIP